MPIEGEISIDLTLKAQVEQVRQRFLRAVQASQEVVARALLADALSYVPVLTGALIDTGRVEHIPTFDDTLVFTRVVFGSNEVVYAERQHEEVFNHPQLGFRGRAKYLERPFTANIDFYYALYELELENRLNSDDDPGEVLGQLGVSSPTF